MKMAPISEIFGICSTLLITLAPRLASDVIWRYNYHGTDVVVAAYDIIGLTANTTENLSN